MKSPQSYFSEDDLEDIYDEIYDYEGELKNCVDINENLEIENEDFFLKKAKRFDNKYDVGLSIHYKYFDGHGADDCYTQQLNVVFSDV